MLDLEVALNYGQAVGAPQLLRFVTEHTEVSWICITLMGVGVLIDSDYSQPSLLGLAMLPRRW